MKFTIRDLLLVTVIVALAVGWWVDHRKLTAEINRLYPPLDFIYHGALLDSEVIETQAPAPNPPKP